jgi:hypothetical protein
VTGAHEKASSEEEAISSVIVVAGIATTVEESAQFVALLVRLPAVRTIEPLGLVQVALLSFNPAAASTVEPVSPSSANSKNQQYRTQDNARQFRFVFHMHLPAAWEACSKSSLAFGRLGPFLPLGWMAALLKGLFFGGDIIGLEECSMCKKMYPRLSQKT